ncbi:MULTISPECIES: RagB/SusD family nutrient uptake outer membrane protein [unclassified Chryseobacterium]|uniref:RagB/SusD family nutrient uptake outer membrane protein n=1 Tax=unclassified Chryseobacterium TaxID=2593645 RepID=UPI000D3B8619|nr:MULTISPECIES: RagB/SusD family nutrient uptake outer membrane protein [unclassified Chryseobacterium]PTT75779.1 RagB/SusD family nutrient uptake outer membrane protein [Chryseobacterium sp. HMWF001]PVV53430.1 RagB/SusD family nutrient uptake outer membrane protein [Chryseobacterium sp. HMWF035]
MRQFKTNIIAVAALLSIFTATSCVNDLEQIPITDVTSASVFTDFTNYPMALAKIYGGFANGGQSSNGGNSDINGIDGNFSQYTRVLYTLQTLPTDEAVIAWNDGTLQTIHKMTWDSSSEFIEGAYYRIFTQIATSNEFLRNVTDEKLAANNITGSNLTEAKYMRAEVRYLRALSYYYALDLFGNVPFVDESYLPGSVTPPKRITRAELFNFVESELLAVAGELKDPKTNVYARADKAAAWSLLARLYLNSGIYNGSNHYTDCITYCNKVIAAGYSLKTKYGDLFLADNDKNNPEVILPVAFDGIHIRTSGGTTYLIHAGVGGSMPASNFGISGGWGGLRTTKAYVNLFSGTPADQRGNFYTNGQSLEINDLGVFTDGYGFIKFKNLTSGGVAGSDASGNFCDTDIPIFRLADIYLMYAEATLRGGSGGNITTALGYVNALRTRAGAPTVSSINTDYILDERGRELGWEMTRRTDLIRYGKFTTASYLWPWKGGVKDGKAVEDFRNLYPIPAKDIIANPNLIQNPGY